MNINAVNGENQLMVNSKAQIIAKEKFLIA